MTSNWSHARRGMILILLAAVVSGSGCSWFRGKSGYENSPESRPLEIPPDLDRPATDPSMQIPDVAASSTPRAVSTGQAFEIADSAEGAWRRVGLALERIEGVNIGERAQLLSVYTVTYEGEEFLVKVAPAGERSRISAVSKSGADLTTGAAGRLLGLLRTRLG